MRVYPGTSRWRAAFKTDPVTTRRALRSAQTRHMPHADDIARVLETRML
ncbi:hypothetical protein [Sphaerisporangium sp. NPDC051011]